MGDFVTEIRARLQADLDELAAKGITPDTHEIRWPIHVRRDAVSIEEFPDDPGPAEDDVVAECVRPAKPKWTWTCVFSSAEERAIRGACDEVAELLVSKNRAYGNSAFDPIRVFSRSDRVEQLRVRLDDKLSRIARGDGSGDEDAELDLLGYLILLRISRRSAS